MTVSIIIIAIGLLGSAFISATEAAVLGASRYRVEYRGEEGDKRARLVVKIFDQYEKFFGTILLVGNLFNVLIASVGTALAISILGNDGDPTIVSTAAATAVATVAIVIVGELTPKTLAVVAPERWALVTARTVLVLMTITWPVVFAFTLVPRGIMRLFGGKESFTSPIVTAGELRTLIDLGEAEGTVEENAGEMQAIIVCDDREETNLMAALLAHQMGPARIIATTNETEYRSLIKSIGIDVCLSPRMVAVSSILRFIRQGRVVTVQAIGDGDAAEVLEFEAQLSSDAVGIALQDLRLPRGALIAALVRRDTVLIPRGPTVIAEGDHVVVLTQADAVHEVEALLQRQSDGDE